MSDTFFHNFDEEKVNAGFKDILGSIFFGWWGEENKVLQWIKAIPFFIVAVPVLLVVMGWEKLSLCLK